MSLRTASPELEEAIGVPLPPLPEGDPIEGLATLRQELTDADEETAPFVPAATGLAYVTTVGRGRAGDHVGAADALREGLAWDPGNVVLASELVVALACLGQTDAAADVGFAITRARGVAMSGGLWMFTAKLLHDEGRYDEALQVLDDLLRTCPDDAVFSRLRQSCLDR